MTDFGAPTGTQWHPSRITLSSVSVPGQHRFLSLLVHFLATRGQPRTGRALVILWPLTKIKGPSDLAFVGVKSKNF